MKFRVYGSRTIHFEIEVDASSYKDLESKLRNRNTLDFYDGSVEKNNKNYQTTTLDEVVRVKDGRRWKDGFLTHTSEGVKSPRQKRYEHLKSFHPYSR